MAPPVLIVPGLNNSGPGHWQSLWENKYPNFRRVEQENWDFPICEEWVKRLDFHISEAKTAPLVIAHSLGCLTVAHWAKQYTRQLHGALLVAPPDLENMGERAESDFLPVPRQRLPFPSLLVASENDPWSTLERSRSLAEAWGSRFVNAGPAGHINADAGFGPWPLGEHLLAEMRGFAAPDVPAPKTKGLEAIS
ncbi:MAG TPA: alpha/beta hydrolase [Terriglobales bacterium]|nr:alpha/beta hydrolase [Terriglobales bacterium]